ncbi:glycosyltransferase family 4 protein [Geopseudomonas guangdongensis]|uniref:Glycosyltransferase involved in cell wall bisynthesis n=1 Tax=Geopseudomonas guangdongensis TaxID=1245526 RepID=A0A1H2E6T3_9GAMM|nr:glycosyltransferase family 4 protein [Pseudomonas guangdongensis]SDT90892.1 Glycosyltransferase involved in cell wall bisynthesis [Pseudomonas guangdongensis]
MNDSLPRVLYLHPAAAFGGASKSLIELFTRLHSLGVQGTVVTPDGPVCEAFVKAGMDVRKVKGLSQFDNTRFSHYRRLRWIILLREIFLLPFSLAAFWHLRHEKFDLLHVNEVTLLPLAIFAKWLLRVPMLVHVRSLQRAPGSGLRTRLVNAWLRRHADAVVAIDHTVAATLPTDLPLSIVHNGLGIENDVQTLSARRADDPVRVGFLGVLIPLKGIYELIEAMRILKARKVNIECLIAGENARKLTGLKAWALRKLGFADDVCANVEQMISDYGLQVQVRMLGFIADVRSLYPQLDILCFPSHLDAAGRPVFEAAFYSIPSVVALTDPMPDALLHEVTGLAIPHPDPELLADALQRLAEDHVFRQTLGRQARQWAEENFVIEANAQLMHDLYRRLLSKS